MGSAGQELHALGAGSYSSAITEVLSCLAYSVRFDWVYRFDVLLSRSLFVGFHKTPHEERSVAQNITLKINRLSAIVLSPSSFVETPRSLVD